MEDEKQRMLGGHQWSFGAILGIRLAGSASIPNILIIALGAFI